MDSPRKLIVGYDLCEEASQISCFSYKSLEPVPISIRDGEEQYFIPTVLCLKTSTKQWLFGEEAIACAKDGGGILVDHILEKVTSSEDVEILGQKISGSSLLEIFLRRTLNLVKNYFPSEPITQMVITVPKTEPLYVEKLYEVLSQLGLMKDRVAIINHPGAYLYYALSQDKALWMNDVGLFDFNKEGLSYYQIRMNRKAKPMVAEIVKTDYTKELNFTTMKLKKEGKADPGYILDNIVNTAVYRQIITTIYFTGIGFEGGWAEDTIRELCTGRRAFIGQNLFVTGACFAAKELSGDKKLEDFILLSDDMVTSYLLLKVYCDTAFKEIPLMEAGENWFEVDHSVEVIVDGEMNFNIIKKNIMTRETAQLTYPLEQLPERENRLTRLFIHATCKDKSFAIVEIIDLGFGDSYPATGRIAEITIEI